MKPGNKKKEAKSKYCPPEIKKYEIAKLASQWDMDTMGSINPCSLSAGVCSCGSCG
jgi:hypothetical protein